MKIYGLQTEIAWEDKSTNLTRVDHLLAACRPDPGSLVVLPEMFATGFSMAVATITEGHSRTTEKFLAEKAKQYQVTLVAGVVNSNPNGRGWNQSVAFSPTGQEIARYTKMQPFNLGGEGEHYEAGTGLVTFPWNGWVVAPSVCYDLRFPELYRSAIDLGATLFVVIANWPIKRIQHWVALLQARAIENQALVVGVNRVGTDPRFVYNGQSLIVHPHGEILARGGDQEQAIQANVDLDELCRWRAEFPALQDRRTIAGKR